MDFREKLINDLEKAGIEVLSHNIVDDLFIKKYEELNQPLYDKILEFPDKLSFTDFESTDREDMEKFAGNFFVDVSDGERGEGEVRLYFMEPNDSFVARGTRFVTDGGQMFQATGDFEITRGEMESQVDGIYYYQSIKVLANGAGEEFNVEAGEITICTNPVIMGKASKIENPFKIEGGRDPETPRELYERVQNSISDRTLANDPGIQSLLRKNFPGSINDIFTVRTGDVHMHRDITMIGNKAHRIGNKHDIWIDSDDLYEEEVVLEKTENRYINLGFSISDLGPDINEIGFEYISHDVDDNPIDKIVVDITKVEALDGSGEVLEEIEGVEFIQEEGLENSVRQKSVLDFDGTTYDNTIANIKVSFVTSRAVVEAQRFVNDQATRMPVGDALVKHFELIPLEGAIYYRGGEDELDLQEKFVDFLKTYDYNALRAEKAQDAGNPFSRIIEVSDFIHALKKHDVDKIKLPISFEVSFPYDRTNQSFYARAGEAVPLDHENIQSGSVIVENFERTTLYIEGSDYEIDYSNGTVTMLESGNMTSNATYLIQYDFNPIQPLEDEMKILPYQVLMPNVSFIKEG